MQQLNISGHNESGIWVTSYKHYLSAKRYLCEQDLCDENDDSMQADEKNFLFYLFQCGDSHYCELSPKQKHEKFDCC